MAVILYANDEAGAQDQRREGAHEGDAAAGAGTLAPLAQEDDMQWIGLSFGTSFASCLDLFGLLYLHY